MSYSDYEECFNYCRGDKNCKVWFHAYVSNGLLFNEKPFGQFSLEVNSFIAGLSFVVI